MHHVPIEQAAGWIATPGPSVEDGTVCDAFARMVEAAPDAVAVEVGGPDGPVSALTYAELDARSRALAAALLDRGVERGERVGLRTRRDADLVVGMLGILRAGAAYLPLDPSLPEARRALMLEDAGARLAAASPGLDAGRPAVAIGAEGGEGPLPEATGGDAAYVVYTSGSTGRPKGVVTPHRAVLRLTQGAGYARLDPGRRVLQLASVGFDAATFEVWGPLLTGGTCVIHPGTGLPDPAVLRRVLEGCGVDTAWLTSSLFNSIVDADPSVLAPLDELLIGGEALSVAHVRRALAAIPARIVNGYGPTEATTFACTWEIPRDLGEVASVPIGRPIANTAVSVRDEAGRPAEAGELWIAGPGLALGYLGRPDLTAERFVAVEDAPGGRAYRTGDLVRLGPDGALAFEGRRDGQVKVAGHRIELGEVEHALAAHPGLRAAAAAVRAAGEAAARIEAWVVPGDGGFDEAALRAHLAERLPAPMVPAAFHRTDALPLTASGKLDRAALAVPVRERPVLERAFEAPRGPLERRIADLWAELIGVAPVGRRDRFFELGGTSLLVMRFVARLGEAGHRLGVAEFFDDPTPAAIAARLEDAAPAPARAVRARADDERVAIVGLAGRFAGAPDVAAFWDMIAAGRSGRVEVGAADLVAAGKDPALLDDPDYVAAAYPLDEAEGFDAAFFGMAPREAELMDPQQRVFLEAAWSALEDAGIDPRGAAERIGVFGGVGRNAYLLENLMSHPALREAAAEYTMLIGNERDFPCTHVAYRLGLRGPAVTVQTGCSTSGVAIHMAAESLRRGECDVALAGGAKVLVPNRVGYRHVDGGPLSADGFIRAFDARATGMVRGSGVAMVAMKRLDDALAAGDHVHAVLIGSAVNNDGPARAGFTAPSVGGQAEVIAEAQRRAGIEAGSVGMLEAHGTGTPLGDPIEVAALARAFEGAGECAIGSVKTNIGHLDAGATAAGVVKAALALQRGVIPPSLNFEEANPKLDLDRSPFRVAARPVPWPRGEAPRRAGVSSFGLGGTNAHLVLEEAPDRPRGPEAPGPQLLVLSARTPAALARRCDDLADRLEREPGLRLSDAAHTLRVGRHRFEERLALVARDRGDAVAKLRARAPADLLRTGLAGEAPPVVLMFPGTGTQHRGMARGLYETEPAFRETIDRLSRDHEARGGAPLADAILRDGPPLVRPSAAQPALFAVEIAVGRLWLDRGVEPAAMIGHSVGEFAAACLAGVLSPEEALDVVATRGRLFDTLPPGAMMGVSCAAEALDLPDGLSVAAVNHPSQCVVSGAPDAVAAFAEAMEREGVATRWIHVDVAPHSPMVEPVLDAWRERLVRADLRPPERTVVSNVTGRPVTAEEATDPDYWVRHLRGTVRFSDGLAAVMEEGPRVLIEAGPGQTLATLARQHPARREEHEVLASLRHPQEAAPDDAVFLAALGRAWRAGVALDWDAHAEGRDLRRAPLPTYPFERARHWIDARPWGEAGAAPAAPEARAPEPHAAPEAAPGPETRRERILARLRGIVHELSGVDPERIDPHATFLELGFDSLFLTQANAAFRRAFGVRLTVRRILEEAPTLDRLATHLDEVVPDDAEPAATAPKAVVETGDEEATAYSPGTAKVSRAGGTTLSPEQLAHIDALIAETEARTPTAKRRTQESRGVLADPRTVQGFDSRWKEMVYPVLSDRAAGSKVWDVDGNEYVDLVGGYGVTFLGHQPDCVVEACRAQLGRSLAIGPQTPLAGEVAEMVSRMTGMDRVAFCNTGSEAVLAAVRIARTATGKSKIAKFDGHYHGIFDEMQVRGAAGGRALPSAPGIPVEAVRNTVVLDYSSDAALDAIRERADDLALVLVEPVRSRNPDFQPREYLHRLRALTAELGIPLLFDEIVTGFRSHPGGAQALFGVRADLATYGKVAGGGLPIGIVAGRAELMATLDGGPWAYGDDSVPTADMTWFAGTFVRHPLALAATRATLRHLEAEGPSLQEGLNARARALADGLNADMARLGAPIHVERFASVLRVSFTRHQQFADLLFFHLRNRGVMTYEGRPIFLSTAHSEADLALVRKAFRESARALIGAGLLDGRDPDAVRRIPMTTGQQEIWVSARFDERASCSYNLCSTLRLRGPLDADALEGALHDLAARHEALRCVPDRDGLVQTVRPVPDLPFERIEGGAEAARRAEVTTPFDLASGPLVRARLVALGPDDHMLLLTVHHVVADGWSCGVLCREIGPLYAARLSGGRAALPPAPQLGAYVAMLRGEESREARAASRDYWLSLYPEGLTPIEFPADRPRPATRDYAARRVETAVDAEVVAGLRRIAREGGTTLFAALLGGFSAYLARLVGEGAHTIGFSAAGQPTMGGGALVGHCVNFLPLRIETDLGASFAQHVGAVGGTVLDALEHQHFDLVSFVQETRHRRSADWAPLVSVGLNLDPASKAVDFPGMDAEADSVGRAYENLDLFLNFVETGDALELQCTFSTALFDEGTIRTRMGEYLRLLTEAVRDPGAALGALDLVAEADRASLPAPPSAHDPHACLVSVFRAEAARRGEATALIEGEARASYADLDAWSDGWARELAGLGVAAGDRVAIAHPRSMDLVAGVLAILKAGGVYVPLDPALPPERMGLVLRDAGVRLLLRPDPAVPGGPDGSHLWRPEAGAPAPGGPGVRGVTLRRPVDPEPFEGPRRRGGDPACLVYTSGSTGMPKGVVVPHRAITRLVLGATYARLDETRTVALLAAPSFDASTFELWGALLNGGRLAVVPGSGVPDLATLGAILAQTGTTTLWLTAGLFDAVVDERPGILEGVEEVLTGGQALSAPHVRRAQAALPHLRIVNGYGPTECTTFACCHPVPAGFDGASVPIGRPIQGTRAHVVDAAMRVLPRGVPGELVLGGDGVALGYRDRPDATRAAFVPDPFGGDGPLYRTGDVVRMRPDGTLDYLGRRDRQLKLRGFRVEPGEVEAALKALPDVRRAAVVGVGDRLLAFATTRGEPRPEALRAVLRDRLPRHLVPDRIRVLDTMPLTPNGKLDRAALEELASGPPPPAAPAPPETETQAAMAALWGDVLGAPVDSVDRSFFDLGGHSLAALRLFDRIQGRFGVDVPISTLFAHPTVRELAAVVEAHAAPQVPSEEWDTTTVLHPGPEAPRRPFFVVGGLGGNANHLVDLGRAVGAHRPAIAFQARGIMGHAPHRSVEEMASENIRWMRRHQPVGPYLLAGYSAGAFVAFEMARQLEAAGVAVEELVVLDTYAPGFAREMGVTGPRGGAALSEVWDRVVEEAPQLLGEGRRYFLQRLRGITSYHLARRWALSRMGRLSPGLARVQRTVEAWIEASDAYRGGPYGGSAMLVLSSSPLPRERRILTLHPDAGWGRVVAPEALSVHRLACNHLDLVAGPHAAALAALIEARLADVLQTA